jgi:glycosyltransferase involved in cell wall biosynthesis
MFGAVRENKGLHLGIRAVQMAASDSRLPVRLTIAGGVGVAEEQYWLTCKQLIAANPDNIDVIALRIPEDEVAPLLARHHAVLLPYAKFFSESGVAALALSHRRPILATAAGGLGELTEQGCWGIPILSPTEQSVAQAIFAAIELGPERLQQMGIEGCEFMRKTRSWDSIARETAELYCQLSIDETVLDTARAFPQP